MKAYQRVPVVFLALVYCLALGLAGCGKPRPQTVAAEAVVADGGCLSVPLEHKPVSQLREMPDRDITAAFAGKVNEYCHRQGDFYYADGGYVSIGGIMPEGGLYVVRDHAICLSYDAGKHFGCKKVYRDGAGKIFMATDVKGQALSVGLAPIPAGSLAAQTGGR